MFTLKTVQSKEECQVLISLKMFLLQSLVSSSFLVFLSYFLKKNFFFHPNLKVPVSIITSTCNFLFLQVFRCDFRFAVQFLPLFLFSPFSTFVNSKFHPISQPYILIICLRISCSFFFLFLTNILSFLRWIIVSCDFVTL